MTLKEINKIIALIDSYRSEARGELFMLQDRKNKAKDKYERQTIFKENLKIRKFDTSIPILEDFINYLKRNES